MHSGEALSATLNSIHNLAYYLGIMERVRGQFKGATRTAAPITA
jgi:queuine tRNA-ribosyltransferase